VVCGYPYGIYDRMVHVLDYLVQSMGQTMKLLKAMGLAFVFVTMMALIPYVLYRTTYALWWLAYYLREVMGSYAAPVMVYFISFSIVAAAFYCMDRK
jgi:hypothetical protein